MSFAEDVRNSNKCPEGSSCNNLCDGCEYKEAPECVPLRIADNLSDIGYTRVSPMEAGITIKGKFRCIFLFEDNTYAELNEELVKAYKDLSYIKINDTVYRKVIENNGD